MRSPTPAVVVRRRNRWRWFVSVAPVWNILSDGDFDLIVANAAHIKNVPGRKTDVNDATWIADLVAHGLIRASFVPKQEFQELRSLLRARKQLVREQSSHILRVQKTLSLAQNDSRPVRLVRNQEKGLLLQSTI